MKKLTYPHNWWCYILGVVSMLLFPISSHAGPPLMYYAASRGRPIVQGEPDEAIYKYYAWLEIGEGPDQCDSDGILYPETVIDFSIPRIAESTLKGIFKEGLKGQKYFKKAIFAYSTYYLPDGVFGECEGLEEIRVDARNETFFSTHTELYRKELDGNALIWASCLTTELEVPDNTVRIAELALATCKDLRWISLPESMRYIGDEAFKSHKLNYVICYALTPPEASQYSFPPYGSTKLFVPAEAVEAYRTTKPWCNFAMIDDLAAVDNIIDDNKDIILDTSTIRLSGFNNGHISVYNMGGSIIAEGINEIDINFPTGIYIVRAADNTSSLVRKVCISN